MSSNKNEEHLDGKTLLQQCQLIELHLLDVFLDICNRHNLSYFLYGGTLLGAVRHGGFIPWDDDIDVAMPIKDYKKFLKLAPQEIPDDFLITPSTTYGGREAFAKLRDRKSFFCEKATIVQEPCGIYIDIFPYEKLPKLPPKIGWILAKWCYLSWLSALAHRNLYHRHFYELFSSGVKAFIWQSVSWFLKYLHYAIGLFVHNVWRCSPEVPLYKPHVGFEESVIFPYKTAMFEGRECNIPNNADSYLTQYYGDWRTLPPPEKREWHASIICPTQAPDAPWATKFSDSKTR